MQKAGLSLNYGIGYKQVYLLYKAGRMRSSPSESTAAPGSDNMIASHEETLRA